MMKLYHIALIAMVAMATVTMSAGAGKRAQGLAARFKAANAEKIYSSSSVKNFLYSMMRKQALMNEMKSLSSKVAKDAADKTQSLDALTRVQAPTMNIVQTAAATPDLSTLVKAIGAAHLEKTLSGPGPFTVFAPTNEAFTHLPPGVLNHLLDPRNVRELDAVLAYHVIGHAAIHSGDLKPEQKVKTLEGQDIEIKVVNGEVIINGVAKVTTANVNCTNGVVHIIDTVLIPPTPKPTKNIVALAESVPDLSTLVTALKAGKLVDTLSGSGPFTVFAPTNQAFAKLPPQVLKYLLEPEHIQKLDAVLEYHVVSGAIKSSALKPAQDVKTLEGSDLDITVFGGHVEVNNANVIMADVLATNGVVHIIDEVLIPTKEIKQINAILSQRAKGRKEVISQ